MSYYIIEFFKYENAQGLYIVRDGPGDNQVSVGLVVMGTGFGRTDSCSNPRNTLGRGMAPNHPELGLDPDVTRRVNRVQTPKKKKITYKQNWHEIC